MDKKALFQIIDQSQNEMVEQAFAIFDHPEYGGEEYFASQLLKDALERRGFAVTSGVGNLATAFRAVWSNGSGGPNIGLLGEYDGVRGMGHVCAHHLQTPAVIAAAVALKKAVLESGISCTITVYGTPAEEAFGGKIVMLENGCFRELDVALATHGAQDTAYVGGESLALAPFRVTFSGTNAHAAGAPWEGRSALDAMLLMFQGIEFMREHVKDGSRMHYSIPEGTGPSNAVPAKASANVTLRSLDNQYLEDMERRFRNIVAGACLMTETEVDIHQFPTFKARRPNNTLGELARSNLHLLMENVSEGFQSSGGSTDFGNVSCAVPGALVYIPYCNAPAHSKAWNHAGKTKEAVCCMVNAAKVLAGIAWDLLNDQKMLLRVKSDFDAQDG